jgi:hypothetical protein
MKRTIKNSGLIENFKRVNLIIKVNFTKVKSLKSYLFYIKNYKHDESHCFI